MAAMDNEGTFDYCRSCLTDITQLLRQEELTYLSTFPMLNPNPVMEVDMTGSIHFMNPATKRLFPDLRHLELKHPWLADWETVMLIFREGKTKDTTREIHIQERWFGQSFYFMENTGKIRIYGREITERKKMHEALQESERNYRDLVENASSIIIRWNPDGEITFFNKYAQLFFGYSQDEIIGRNVTLLIPEKDSRGMDLSHLVTDILNHPAAYVNNENENVLKNGNRVWVQWTNKVVMDEAGRVREVLAIGNDITERKRIEIALQEKTLLVENANKEMKSFSYSVSHDLRAPLRAVDGYARMILKKHGDDFDEDTLSKFNVIRTNAQRIGMLIEDLLTFSQMSRAHLSMFKVDMDDLVRETFKELQIIHPDRSMSLKLNPVPHGKGDRALLKQVLSHILSNAVKFAKAREDALVEVGGYEEGNEIIYYIKDNGIGFDMNYHDKLFGVFQRLHADEEYEGTGVGLALVRRIISRHGGRVWAKGKVDQCACFYFTLPKL
jgi:PAS domain S-box-containing protein